MKEIIFASNNTNKADEIRAVLPNNISIITIAEAGINIEIPEPHQTLAENALEKSMTIFNIAGKDCFSEDTGLEVDALQGEPGVKTARYAGEPANMDRNIEKLLNALNGKNNRTARFRTVISLILGGEAYYFEGICEGVIVHEKSGVKGFGYDPVFMPDGSNKTFAEMNTEEKNLYSHRNKATKKLIEFLQKK